MTVDTAWVALAPTVDPIKEWLRTETGQTVSFGRAPGADPAKAKPPFTVLSIVSDPRLILSMDGNQPVEVTWQLDFMGETPLQALGLFDLGARAMVIGDPPALPGATVDVRESRGDVHGPDKVADRKFVVQARCMWRLIGAVLPDTP